MQKLLLEEAEYIAHELAKELFKTFDEPMPDFYTRFTGRLESCLDTPFQTFNGQDLYGKKVIDKAVILLYLVIKNHPFANGNKRMAITLMLTFLFKNGYWLRTTPETLYKLAVQVATSKPSEKDETIKKLCDILNKQLTKRRAIRDLLKT